MDTSVSTFSRLQVIRTGTKAAQMSLKFGQIGPPTAELDALERLKNPHRLKMGKTVSALFPGCFYLISLILAGNVNM